VFENIRLSQIHGQYVVHDGDVHLINAGRRPVDKTFYLNVLRTLEGEPTSVYYKGDKVSS
jgi:hypothetical protein